MGKIKEVELDHAFAHAVETSPAFRASILQASRFSRLADTARLLADEQLAARKNAKHWWKHWWCSMPDGTQGETDIFIVFDAGAYRFALHIENKPPHGSLGLDQAVRYRQRAAFKAFDPRWLSYSDFETVLLAPAAFIAQNATCAGQFDRTLTYEAVGASIPLFAAALLPL